MVRRKGKSQTREYITTALLSVGIVWLTFLIFSIARKEEIARTTVRDTRAELAILQARKDTLQGNLDELGTERGQEATLRQTYGVARPGEEVIVVVPPKIIPPPPELSWWEKLLNWFGF